VSPPVRKVLIYATSPRGLLVFDEPDFPEVPLQVPGGNVEAGEDDLEAAQREFMEETGLPCPAEAEFMRVFDYRFERDGVARRHRRSLFRFRLGGDVPVTWEHVERSPSNGAAPIRFRLFWIDPREAPSRLGLGMGIGIEGLAG